MLKLDRLGAESLIRIPATKPLDSLWDPQYCWSFGSSNATNGRREPEQPLDGNMLGRNPTKKPRAYRSLLESIPILVEPIRCEKIAIYTQTIVFGFSNLLISLKDFDFFVWKILISWKILKVGNCPKQAKSNEQIRNGNQICLLALFRLRLHNAEIAWAGMSTSPPRN